MLYKTKYAISELNRSIVSDLNDFEILFTELKQKVLDFNETYRRLEQFYLNFIKNFNSFDVAFKAMSRKYVIENYIRLDEPTTYILFDYDYTLLIKDYSNTSYPDIKLDINDIKNDISIVEYMINQVNKQIDLFQSFEKNNQ